MSTVDLDDERAVLEVVEFSDSEDEDFDYKAVEVWVRTTGLMRESTSLSADPVRDR